MGALPRLTDLVERDRVHRSLYTDPAIFDLEMKRIFGRAWLYVGHASQIPEKGDYFTTELAGQPVVMVRQPDGGIRVLFNRCGHRGAIVAPGRTGKVQNFVCGYHGWVFGLDGCLKHAAAHDGCRANDFDAADPAFGMRELPRVHVYRDFVFASLSADGDPLEAWLGGVKAAIDHMIDRSPDDELEVEGGCFRISQRSNWKIFVENTQDGLHPMPVHASSVQASRRGARAFGDAPPFPLRTIMANGQNQQAMDALSVVAFPHGHSYMAGFRNPNTEDDVFRDYLSALEAKKGRERAAEILKVNYHNALFYPNASVQPSFLQLRTIFPVSVDRTRMEMWSFRLKGAPDSYFERTVQFANTVWSPSSLIRPDDVEMYARVQAGLHAHGADWVSHHRDAGREERDGEALKGTSVGDLPLRNQFQTWLTYMTDDAAV